MRYRVGHSKIKFVSTRGHVNILYIITLWYRLLEMMKIIGCLSSRLDTLQHLKILKYLLKRNVYALPLLLSILKQNICVTCSKKQQSLLYENLWGGSVEVPGLLLAGFVPLVLPSSNPRSRFVNSQLVCLLPSLTMLRLFEIFFQAKCVRYSSAQTRDYLQLPT